MKRFDIRKAWIALALVLALCLAAPAMLPARLAPAFTAQAAAKVKLNKTKATLYIGDTLKLKLANAKGKVAWKSSNSKVAAVSGAGKVTAKKAGSATVTATNGNKKYTCKVTVKSGLAAGNSTVSLVAGSSYAVTIRQMVAGKVTIKSSNPAVAAAHWDGSQKKGTNALLIQAVDAGSAVITLKNTSTKETLKINVTVSAVPNRVLVLDKASDANLVIPVFEPIFSYPKAVQINLYSDRTDRELTAEVADETVAECYWDYWGWIDDNRLLYIKGLKPGSTMITVRCNVTDEILRIRVTVAG